VRRRLKCYLVLKSILENNMARFKSINTRLPDTSLNAPDVQPQQTIVPQPVQSPSNVETNAPKRFKAVDNVLSAPKPFVNKLEESKSPEDESWAQWGTRFAARTPTTFAKIAMLPGDLAQAWGDYIIKSHPPDKTLDWEKPLGRVPLPQSKDVDKVMGYVAKIAGLPSDYFKQQGKLDEFADMMTVDLPQTIFLAGTPFWKHMLTSAAGAGAQMAARESDLGPVGELAAGTLGRVGTSYLTRGGAARSLIKKGTEIKDKNYKLAENQVTKIPEYFEPELEQQIAGIHDRTVKDPGFEGQDRAIKWLQNIGNKFSNGKVSIKDIWDEKKSGWKLYQEEPHNPKYETMRQTIKEGQDVLNTLMKKAEMEHPTFGIPYRTAEDLHAGLGAKKAFQAMAFRSKTIRDLLGSNKVLKNILFGAGGYGLGHGVLTNPIGAAKKAAIMAGVGIPTRAAISTVYGAYKSPVFRNLVQEAARRATVGDKEGLALVLTKLNKATGDDQAIEEQEAQSVPKKQARFTRIG
jgi:hypothetical protein